MSSKLLRYIASTTMATIALSGFAAPASAQALRDDWCSDVSIRFFAGGAEGDAFASIVYNGAVQAAKDTGAKVDYVFSGWKPYDPGVAQAIRDRVVADFRAADTDKGVFDAGVLKLIGALKK